MMVMTANDLGDMAFAEIILAGSFNYYRTFKKRMPLDLEPVEWHFYRRGVHLLDSHGKLYKYMDKEN